MCLDAAKPKRVLTDEEKAGAYELSVKELLRTLKAPSTATFQPAEEARFSPAIRSYIDVRLWVDAQNSFGAMLRVRYVCSVGPERPDGLHHVFCRRDGFGR